MRPDADGRLVATFAVLPAGDVRVTLERFGGRGGTDWPLITERGVTLLSEVPVETTLVVTTGGRLGIILGVDLPPFAPVARLLDGGGRPVDMFLFEAGNPGKPEDALHTGCVNKSSTVAPETPCSR